jgi:Zn-dependent peptidase ImmA (M78 family)
MSVRVPIDGETLEAARSALHMSLEDLGRAANLSAERIAEFELGYAQPTHKQMRSLARRLDRPLAFFLAPPPEKSDVPATADFRSRGHDVMPSALAREMKRAATQRRAFLDLASEVPVLKVPGRVEWQNVTRRATQFRSTLGLTDDFRPVESQTNAVFNFWRGQLEAAGYLVFQSTGIDFGVFRGLSVEHRRVPIILLNGADSPNGKVFTMFHEVAHIANRTSGLCALEDDVAEEAICNAFAANFLMPAPVVRRLLETPGTASPVQRIARHFRVSELAAAVRLKVIGVLDEDGLSEVRESTDAAWEEYRQRQRQSDGFVPNWQLRYRDLGATYMRVVFEALERDSITPVDATYLLNARMPTLEKIQSEFFRTGGK